MSTLAEQTEDPIPEFAEAPPSLSTETAQFLLWLTNQVTLSSADENFEKVALAIIQARVELYRLL